MSGGAALPTCQVQGLLRPRSDGPVPLCSALWRLCPSPWEAFRGQRPPVLDASLHQSPGLVPPAHSPHHTASFSFTSCTGPQPRLAVPPAGRPLPTHPGEPSHLEPLAGSNVYFTTITTCNYSSSNPSAW